jgi:hypothetical protein
MLKTKLGDQANTILTTRVMENIKSEFNINIKRNFDEDSEEEYEVDMGRAPDMPEIGLEEGMLKLSMYCHSHQHF